MIIQIAREVDWHRISWKLYTEMVSLIYSPFSLSSKDLIGVLYYFYLFGTFTRIEYNFLY